MVEWRQLCGAEADIAIDVTKVDKVNQTELLKAFLPVVAKPAADRTAQETATISVWHAKVMWFLALRRVGLAPTFECADP